MNTIKEVQLFEEIIFNNRNNKKFKFHQSWLRLYAVELSKDCYIITGGAIKLTDKMSQRKHTIKERDKMNMCLQYLKENGINDNKGITETIELHFAVAYG